MNKAPLTDGQHHAVICRYREWRSMAKVAKAYRISPAPVHAHVKLHNKLIEESPDWICDKCYNAGDSWVAFDHIDSPEERRYYEMLRKQEEREEVEDVVAIPIEEWRRMERERVNKIMKKDHEVVHQEQETGV